MGLGPGDRPSDNIRVRGRSLSGQDELEAASPDIQGPLEVLRQLCLLTQRGALDLEIVATAMPLERGVERDGRPRLGHDLQADLPRVERRGAVGEERVVLLVLVPGRFQDLP